MNTATSVPRPEITPSDNQLKRKPKNLDTSPATDHRLVPLMDNSREQGGKRQETPCRNAVTAVRCAAPGTGTQPAIIILPAHRRQECHCVTLRSADIVRWRGGCTSSRHALVFVASRRLGGRASIRRRHPMRQALTPR